MKEPLNAKMGHPVEEIYDDEAIAAVIHRDNTDSLKRWQQDQSEFIFILQQSWLSPSFQQPMLVMDLSFL